MIFDKVLPIQQIWDRCGYILGYPGARLATDTSARGAILGSARGCSSVG